MKFFFFSFCFIFVSSCSNKYVFDEKAELDFLDSASSRMIIGCMQIPHPHPMIVTKDNDFSNFNSNKEFMSCMENSLMRHHSDNKIKKDSLFDINLNKKIEKIRLIIENEDDFDIKEIEKIIDEIQD